MIPWIVAHQSHLYIGFSRQESWRGLPFPTPGDLPDPGIKPASLESPALAGRFFYHWATWEAPLVDPGLIFSVQFSSFLLLSHVQLFATPCIAAHQASITNSWSSPKLMSIELVMPSSHLILCHPLLLLPPIPPSIRVFSNESTFHMRWPKYWSFSFSISPSKEHPGLAKID